MIRRSLIACLLMASAVPAAAQTAAMEKQLAEAGATLRRLADERQIERVQRAYGYYVDKAMWDNVADLFATNGTLEIGGRGVFVTKARVLQYMRIGLGPDGPRAGIVIDHTQFQGVVHVAPDGQTAKGRWRAFVMGIGRGPVIGVVTYENDYVREDGVWKIAALRAPFVMYTEAQTGWETSAVINTKPSSFPPLPDRPPSVLYETYPTVYAPPFHYTNPVTGK